MAIGTAAGIIAGLAGSAMNSGVSNSYSLMNGQSDSWSDSGSYNMSMGNSWTDAESANEWAHNEAELNRLYQTYMSNTAYQRAVEDLKAAGLNPVLAAWNGGSSSPMGTQAQTFMNSGSSSYSEGGSGSHSESHSTESSESESNSRPAWMKLFSGLSDVIGAIPEAYQGAYTQARGYAGPGY